MEEIQEWLAGPRVYRIGRALYNAYGPDAELKALFAEGATAWNVAKLTGCLQELATGTQAKVQHDEYSEMPAGDNAVLQSLQAAWQPVYQLMNYKRHELDKYPNDDAQSEAIRRNLAFEILDLEQQCMAMWKKRDYYQAHGKLPDVQEKKAPVLTDPIAIGRRIETLQRNVRRNKKKAIEHPDNAEYPALVQQYEAELHTLTQHDTQTTGPTNPHPQEPGSY